MDDIFGIILLSLFCYCVSYLEFQKHRTILTPFNMMVYPYTAVAIMINTVGKYFGFFHVSLNSIIFVIFCLIFFKLGGWFTEKFFYNRDTDRKIVQYDRTELESLFNTYKILFLILAVISIIASIIHFHHSLDEVGGWMYLASEEFENAYGKGLLSHVIQLNRPAFTFLCAYYFYSKKKYVLVLLFAMFLSILAVQLKTHIITTFLSGILFSYMIRVIKFNMKKLLIYCLLIFLFFNLSYTIGYSRIGIGQVYNEKVQSYLINLFFAYLFGGPIGLSEILGNPLYPLYSTKEMLAVPINIYNLICGNPQVVDVIIHNWIPISARYQYFHSTNVFTLFGMLYIYIGTYAVLIYMYLAGVVAYFLKTIAFQKNAYVGFQLAYSFLLSFLTISFFGNFFNQLQIYHTSFLMILLPFLYQKFRSFLKIVNENIAFNNLS